ncbi:DNA polymerase III subunit tau [compost metagenome]
MLAMSERQALYRKHRPQTFSDLVGQEHISRTLGNAITHGKIAHAYLFTGPRGTGKTSSARILAKALNCEKGPTPNPCVVRKEDPASLAAACPACKGITDGSFVDVIEIDAASNNGVDDARDLREKVRFAPVAGRYKVYIIDEVHMLSNAAFNALLKTIEEPPPNLVFVLATTDVHKVLPTVISRCQRFDFQRIPFPAMVDHLERIAGQEQVSVARAGIEALAKRADGGLRDGLSLLDQVISTGSGTISAEDVFNALGLMSAEAVLGLGKALADKQPAEAIALIQALLAQGYDHYAVLREWMELYRHLMLLQMAGDRAAALDVPSWLMDGLKPLTERFSASEILYSLEVLRETEALLKGSHQMTIWLEAAAVRLASRDDIPSIKALSERVTELEERLASLGQGGMRPVAREAAPARPAPAPARPAEPAIAPPPAQAGPVREPAHPPADARPPVPAAAPVAPPVSAPVSSPSLGGADVLGKVIDGVNRVHRSTGSLLGQHGVFARFESETVTLGIKPTVKMFFEKQDRRAYIEKAIKATFGANARVQLTFENGPPASTGVASTPASAPAPAPMADPTPAPPMPPAAAAPLAVTPPEPQPAPSAPLPAMEPSAERSVPHAAPALEPPAEAPQAALTADFEVPDREPPSDEDWSEPTTDSTEDLSLGVPLAPTVMDRPAPPPASDDVVGKAAEIFSGRVIDPIE